MTLAMTTYTRAPAWMQNLLLSAYGVRLQRLRYGKVGRETLASLRESQWMSADDVRRYQLSSLSQVVRQAAADVPFYRRRGLKAPQWTSLDQLRSLPILSKAEVQQAGRDMISDRYRDLRLEEIHTGGTTGTPLAVWCDSSTLQRNYAFFSRFKETAGIDAKARVATFAGRTLVPNGSGGPYWRRNLAANTLLFSSYHLAPHTLPSYVQALSDFAPALIDSYPSSIEPIARYIVREGIKDIRPRALITSSETLFPAVREVIESAFGCSVFDHYGSAEMVALIAQCQHGTYHVAPEFGVVEVLNHGEPVRPGQRGEIVATGFINPVMPFIRYATGDYAVLGSGRCSCGRAGQTVERLEGRMDDVLITPEGNLVGRLDPIFKAVSAIQETQIIQDATDHVRVEVVVQEELPAAIQSELHAQLRSRLGSSMRIDIVGVPGIKRTARGKLRTTVNLVGRSSSEAKTDSA